MEFLFYHIVPCYGVDNEMIGSLPIVHLLAEGTLITGLEVAFVHSPRPSEAQGQPKHHNRCHSTKT